MMMRSNWWSPDEGTSEGMNSAILAAAASAETGAKTRVKGLSAKFVRTNMAKVATTTFLKERRRGFLRDRCILGRSPCELVTSAFARLPSEVGDYLLHIASDARGWGLRMVETIKLASNEALSKPQR